MRGQKRSFDELIKYHDYLVDCKKRGVDRIAFKTEMSTSDAASILINIVRRCEGISLDMTNISSDFDDDPRWDIKPELWERIHDIIGRTNVFRYGFRVTRKSEIVITDDASNRIFSNDSSQDVVIPGPAYIDVFMKMDPLNPQSTFHSGRLIISRYPDDRKLDKRLLRRSFPTYRYQMKLNLYAGNTVIVRNK